MDYFLLDGMQYEVIGMIGMLLWGLISNVIGVALGGLED